MNYKPHGYQDYATEHIIQNKAAGLFMEMGLGKTAATLTAIYQLMHVEFEVAKVIVIAPLNVAKNVWTDEIEKWGHLHSLKASKILGTEKERIKGLRAQADIYLINRENIVWLIGYLGGAWPFDMIVIDESSSFKSHKSARFKALKLVRPISSRVVELTGTPGNLMDLWAQIYLLDMGQRLGQTITGYRTRYFNPDKQNGHIIYSYKVKPETTNNVYKLIGDICVSMRAKDYLSLPERISRSVKIYLSEKVKKQYDNFEKTQLLALLDEEDNEISAVNAAALCSKLGQFANGAIYDENKSWHQIHDDKLEALAEIIDAANGSPVMVFYWFKHDLERIQTYLNRLKSALPALIKKEKDVVDWNNKEIPVFLLHPASAGHGLNLQAGGNIIVWFGLTWSLELYQQANARLDRQGQLQAVIIHHLIAKGTIDEDIMRAIYNKTFGQDAIMDAVKARIKKLK